MTDVIDHQPDTSSTISDDPAAAWRGRLDYRIAVDLAACHHDAYGRLHIHGEFLNLGDEGLDFGGDPQGALRIGARVLTETEPARHVEARAIPPTRIVPPGARAPFRLQLPPGSPRAGIELSLISEGRIWLCDLGFPSITLAPAPDAPVDASVDTPLAWPETFVDPGPGALRDYYTQRFGSAPIATLDDIFNCYRILLDRRPDPGGFAHFATQVGNGIPVASLVALFTGSEEYKRRIAPSPVSAAIKISHDGVALYTPLPETPETLRIVATGHVDPHVADAMARVLAAGQFVVDVGAGFGAFTALAAGRVGPSGRVVALEPNARLMRLLLANITASGFTNVDVLPFCAADGDGFATLLQRGSIMTATDVSQDDLTSGEDVPVVYARTLDSILPLEQPIDVLNLALDGYDNRAVLGAKALLSRWRPQLFGDYAPGLLNEFSGIAPQHYLELLRDIGYNDFTAMSREHGPIALGDDIAKLAAMPVRLGAANVAFHAQVR